MLHARSVDGGRVFAVLIVAISLGTVGACGSVASSVSQRAGASEACRAQCEWDARCGGVDSPECASVCENAFGDAEANIKPEFFERMASCFPTLPCDRNDDECVEGQALAMSPNLDQDPVYLRCLEREQDCGEDVFEVLRCLIGPAILIELKKQELAQCLELACSEIEPCQSALL